MLSEVAFQVISNDKSCYVNLLYGLGLEYAKEEGFPCGDPIAVAVAPEKHIVLFPPIFKNENYEKYQDIMRVRWPLLVIIDLDNTEKLESNVKVLMGRVSKINQEAFVLACGDKADSFSKVTELLRPYTSLSSIACTTYEPKVLKGKIAGFFDLLSSKESPTLVVLTGAGATAKPSKGLALLDWPKHREPILEKASAIDSKAFIPSEKDRPVPCDTDISSAAKPRVNSVKNNGPLTYAPRM